MGASHRHIGDYDAGRSKEVWAGKKSGEANRSVTSPPGRHLVRVASVSSRPRWRRPGTVFGALVVAAATLSACGNGSATPALKLDVHVPKGWTTHAYDGIAISAPAGWKYYGPGSVIGCPDPQNGGLLALGATYSGAACPSTVGPLETTISIQSGLGSGSPSTHRARVNGLNVKVVDHAAGIIWFVPSRNLTVSGSGPEANKVLHTLRPA